MEELFKDVKAASCQIFEKIRKGLDESFYMYDGRGAGGDLSSRIDLFAEEIFIDKLQKYGKIVSEEAGEIGQGERVLIIDPIDGSDNLLSTFPYYGSSIALQVRNTTLFSFVVNYATGDFFVKWDSFYKKGSLFHNRLKDIRVNYHAKVGLFEKAYANADVVAKLKVQGSNFAVLER